MFGAVIGDIAGSRFEWNNIKTKDFELFAPRCSPTDDSIMTLAIARALLAGGRILILDEATSALDPATEQRVLQQIASSYPHHTTIIITHRPEALKYADQCLRL